MAAPIDKSRQNPIGYQRCIQNTVKHRRWSFLREQLFQNENTNICHGSKINIVWEPGLLLQSLNLRIQKEIFCSRYWKYHSHSKDSWDIQSGIPNWWNVDKNTPGLQRYIHKMYVEWNEWRTIGRTISSTKVSTAAGMLLVSEVVALFS